MRGAGRDCTDLFDEYHAWVSAEAYMAIGQRIGMQSSLQLIHEGDWKLGMQEMGVLVHYRP
jgi:hypothetical protein